MAIRNTGKEGGLEMLMESILAGTADGQVEKQEARGQKEFVASEQLPVEGSDDPYVLALGIEFGEPSSGDDLFREAKLPEGWTKRATEHSMWSEIVDETGEARASVFYKAAFYDRRAFIRAVPSPPGI